VSEIATAMSTALDAAIPAISVSDAVATARIASAPRPSARERGARPSTSCWKIELGEQEQRRSAERQEREAERRVVAGVRDGELVGDGDRDQREHDERQRPRAPQPDGAGVLGALGGLDTKRLGALEVAPPQRDGPREADRQRDQPLDRERLARERGARRQHGLAQHDDEEQAEALDEMAAGDLGVLERDAPAPAGQPVLSERARVDDRDRDSPEQQARVAVGDRAGHPEDAGQQLPDQVVDEVLTLRPAAQGHDEEHAAADLEAQVAGDEQPRAVAEGVVDRDGHEQAGEHQPDEHQARGQRVRIEPVRPPRDHVPGVEDRERQDRRLGAGAQIDVCDQVVRELADREDVDEVEEQLQRRDLALSARRSLEGGPHRPDRTPGRRRG
jgi:hypothetical protein